MTTVPEQPSSGEILRAIGRVEKTMDGLTVQVHRLDDKLDGHGETLAGHGERILATERDIRDIKAERGGDRAASQQHASNARVGVKVAIITAALSVLGTGAVALLQLLAHH